MFKKSFLKDLAKKEFLSYSFLFRQLKRGRIVIPGNKRRKLIRPVVIGEGAKIKINTNIGTSTEKVGLNEELRKLKTAVSAGTDTVMDLSVGGDLRKIRKVILDNCPVALGTVPVYEAAFKSEQRAGSFEQMNFSDIWDVLVQQAQDGVDFFTIHAGILRRMLESIQKKKRTAGIVSRGGAILARWMHFNKRENPFYEKFDKVLQLAKDYNITLSLGDALRPGAIADSTDTAQISELKVLGGLVKRCREKGVQVIVEGPGHIRLDQIALNMKLQKKYCHGAPFYILGPLPTDIAAGYDHITSSIGGAIASLAGADFLCVVTPAEHLRHPSEGDIKEGVIASRIAAHCVDVLRFKDEWNRDYLLSRYRARREWEKLFPLTIDEEKARKYRKLKDISQDMCTMCGKFCSLEIIDKCKLLK